MSKARVAFECSIKDADELLNHFDRANQSPSAETAEVLKRASLIMALTAWETYVEDRIQEELDRNLKVVSGSYLGKFVSKRLEEELKRFHNPNSEKTRRIFMDYADTDVTAHWSWQHFDPTKAKKTLDELISKRGDAVHRAKPPQQGAPSAHLIKRDELEKAIKFLKSLVEVTDRALAIS